MRDDNFIRFGHARPCLVVTLLSVALWGCAGEEVTPVGESLDQDLSSDPTLDAHENFLEQEGIMGGMEMEDGSKPY